MPWPKEEVVVQQGCSRLEELGLFPCSRPTAKVLASYPGPREPGYEATKVRVLIFGLFQIMRIHSYGGRLLSIVGSRFKEVLRALLWILMRYCR